MDTEEVNKGSCDEAPNDDELIDTLIAISVVSKRLATKLKQENTEKEDKLNEQNE